MLLYIHVPFCRKKCAYCAFYSMPVQAGEPVEESVLLRRFADAACRELALWQEKIAASSFVITSVFFGGGTPSLLPPALVGRILDEAGRLYSLSEDAEITLEANPESALKNGWLKGVRGAGANRISFGAQSFLNDDLAFLGRLHSAHQVEEAVTRARQAGFDNVSLDLMWGLPLDGTAVRGRGDGHARKPFSSDQTRSPGLSRQHGSAHVDRWLAVLERAVALAPEHISAYALTVEEDTPLADMLEGSDRILPSDRDEERIFHEGVRLLESSGYAQYEVSNFCRPGMDCRHNAAYWDGEEYLGVGPSAVGTLGGVRYSNTADFAAWERGVFSGSPGYEREVISPETARKERLMLSLRTTRGLDLARWKQEGGTPFEKACPKLVSALMHEGLAQLRGGHLSLTRKGLLVSNGVIERFFEADGLFGG